MNGYFASMLSPRVKCNTLMRRGQYTSVGVQFKFPFWHQHGHSFIVKKMTQNRVSFKAYETFYGIKGKQDGCFCHISILFLSSLSFQFDTYDIYQAMVNLKLSYTNIINYESISLNFSIS